MVTKISFPKRVEAALYYNEKKVAQGVATCIAAEGYLASPERLTHSQKLEGLQRRNALNGRAQTKTVHISLNFHPSEELGTNTLLSIAHHYMEGLGFRGQPYLLYEHRDAGHPHLHLIASTIREDGTRIPTHGIGRGVSEVSRKNTEEHFRLVKAGGRKTVPLLQPLPASAVTYGKRETLQAIAAVVSGVIRHYRFTTFTHFGAALQLYGVTVNRGKPGSRMYHCGGLYYQICAAGGKTKGVPIKASLLPGRPTLATLEGLFQKHASVLPGLKPRVIDAIESTMAEQPPHLEAFTAALAQQEVTALIYKNERGIAYGITFVDRNSGGVFKGSELGRGYTVQSLLRRLPLPPPVSKAATEDRGKEKEIKGFLPPVTLSAKESILEGLQALVAPLPTEAIPFPFKKKKGKRKKRPL